MLLGVIIDLVVGLLCTVMGALVWKKKKLSILHEYHYKHVKQKDIPAYTKGIGIGLILIGAGIILTGLLNLAKSSIWWIPLAGGFASGLTELYITQKKYNGSVMG